jgi:quercetin dioxygenase-like cupin family protein
MGYRVLDPEAVDPDPDRPCELRRLSAPAGLDSVAVNRFVAAPGEQIPLAYHYHTEQEEAFYVLDGRIEVETPDGVHEVPAGHLFAADPESPHRAYAPEDAAGPATVLAIGAPPVAGDAEVYDDGGQ